MRKTHVILLVVAALVGGAIVLNQTFAQEKPAPAATRTAVCDMASIFRNYDRSKDLIAKFKQRMDKIKAEADDRSKAIEKTKAMLDLLEPGSAEYEKQLDNMTDLTIQRDAWLTFQEELRKRENLRYTRDMYNEALAAIEKVAKARGFQIVLFKDTTDQTPKDLDEFLQQMARRKVLYSDPSLDITEDVLKQLNLDYANRGKEPEKPAASTRPATGDK